MLARTRKACFQILMGKPFFCSQSIFILSHQRSRSTLLSHILGSNPFINGYYEIHMAYYSQWSIYKARYQFASEHVLKPSALYYLDKNLHNENFMSKKVISSPKTKLIFLVREPVSSINSLYIMTKQYNVIDPGQIVKNSINYYIERLDALQRYWSLAPKETRFALCSDRLLTDEDTTLANLSEFLSLPRGLTSKYEKFKYTGVAGVGDPSQKIASKDINQEQTEISIILNKSQHSRLMKSYSKTMRVMGLDV